MADTALPLMLQITGQVLFTETASEMRLAVAAQSGTKRVAFSAVGDTCPLCLALDGKVFLADSAEAALYSPPLHINCDCIWTSVGDDEVGAIDWFNPKDQQIQDLAQEHGHLMPDAEGQVKYEALKIPASPSGRDFTFRRGKQGELGRIEWHRPRYALGDEFQQSGVTAAAKEKWAAVDLKTLDQAKTTAELEAWARMRWPHMTVDLAGGETETLRETLGQLDQLGQQYREVEAAIPSLKVLPVEEFGLLGNPMAFAATNENSLAINLNALWYADRAGFDAAWSRDVKRAVTLDLPARQGVMTHEFGEAYRVWLQRTHQDLWTAAQGLATKTTAAGLGSAADQDPDELLAEAFAVMHLTPRSDWPPFLDRLRPLLRYELRRPF